ncbi:Glutaredoxin domain profile [Nakaseomyces glabratus]|nr:Glutaredoxin domain profile [Nakaseomyces glabratus]KAH7587446.1 Glutaredoxin domain profile [Nakaseomyces glabratus]KAI8392658.1 Glutaredoxin domain profile [Nakaseomyces glabratus]
MAIILSKRIGRLFILTGVLFTILYFLLHFSGPSSADSAFRQVGPGSRNSKSGGNLGPPIMEAEMNGNINNIEKAEAGNKAMDTTSNSGTSNENAQLPGSKDQTDSNSNSLSTKEGQEDAEEAADAEYSPAKEFQKLIKSAPIVIFSKSYCPFSKNLKKLLDKNYRLDPAYVAVEVDQHPNGDKLYSYIKKLTGRNTVPNLIANGDSKGGFDDMLALHNSNELESKLIEWGVGELQVSKV